MRSAPERTPVCFAGHNGHELAHDVAGLRLNARDSEALAELLPVLICGEESAGLVFARLSQASDLALAHDELSRIEREEFEHARLLSQVRLALPKARTDAALARAAKLFFMRMSEHELGRHFARIAALDSGVCVLLGALRRRTTPTAAEPVLNPMFARIHRDEARHVLVTRRYARALAGSQRAEAIAHDTRRRLVELLTHRAAALEQLLCIDADKLFARLRNPPRGLFA
jgi:hypothetical protein